METGKSREHPQRIWMVKRQLPRAWETASCTTRILSSENVDQLACYPLHLFIGLLIFHHDGLVTYFFLVERFGQNASLDGRKQ